MLVAHARLADCGCDRPPARRSRRAAARSPGRCGPCRPCRRCGRAGSPCSADTAAPSICRRAGSSLGLRKLAHRAQQQAERGVGDLLVEHLGRVGDGDAVLDRIFDVDVVVADAEARNEFELRATAPSVAPIILLGRAGHRGAADARRDLGDDSLGIVTSADHVQVERALEPIDDQASSALRSAPRRSCPPSPCSVSAGSCPRMRASSNLHVRVRITSPARMRVADVRWPTLRRSRRRASRTASLDQASQGVWQWHRTRNGSAGSAWAAWAIRWPSGCSRPATTSRSGTAPAPRPSRSPSSAARSSTSSPISPACDMVFSIVAEGKDVEQVYFGKDGVLLRQQDARRVRRLLDHRGRGVRRDPQAPEGARRRLPLLRR